MTFNRAPVKGTPGERYAIKLLQRRGSMGLISGGWGLMKHLKFKTGGILLERGVQFNRKGGLV